MSFLVPYIGSILNALALGFFFRHVSVFAVTFENYFVEFHAVPEGKDEKTELEVYDFTGEGGVAIAMYNTDEVWTLNIICFSLFFVATCNLW